jgi:4-hydroxy-tetrahydrodipicolinate reductase
MAEAIKIAVAGSSGRMGRAILEAIATNTYVRLAAALEQNGNPYLGQDAGDLFGAHNGVTISAEIEPALAGCDVLIDFTRPEATMRHLEICRAKGVGIVIGTTGFDAAQTAAIKSAGSEIGIVMAPNMSVGTNLIFKLCDIAARALGDGYDVEILEAHHRHKVDAPSGTALHIGSIVAQARGSDLDDCAVYGRRGVTGERKGSTIGFSSIRGGDIVGDHTVLFAGLGERVELSVKASSRATYALGALRAAQFVRRKAHGLFDMQDVLGLR